jgi:hypothetical protein
LDAYTTSLAAAMERDHSLSLKIAAPKCWKQAWIDNIGR